MDSSRAGSKWATYDTIPYYIVACYLLPNYSWPRKSRKTEDCTVYDQPRRFGPRYRPFSLLVEWIWSILAHTPGTPRLDGSRGSHILEVKKPYLNHIQGNTAWWRRWSCVWLVLILCLLGPPRGSNTPGNSEKDTVWRPKNRLKQTDNMHSKICEVLNLPILSLAFKWTDQKPVHYPAPEHVH